MSSKRSKKIRKKDLRNLNEPSNEVRSASISSRASFEDAKQTSVPEKDVSKADTGGDVEPKATPKVEESAKSSLSKVEKNGEVPSSAVIFKKGTQSQSSKENIKQENLPPKGDKTISNGKKPKTFFKAKVAPEKVEFSLRHMSLMLKTGMSLTEALNVILEQTTDVNLRGAYEEISFGVQQGKSLSEKMNNYPKIFSAIVISIIRVSEQTGTLERNLVFLADYIKKNYELDRKVKGALIYPIIVLGLTVSEMLGVVFFILPKLEVMFASFPNIPKFSLMVVNLAKLFRENIVLILIGGVVLFFLISRFMNTAVGRKIADKIAISFPVFKRLNVGSLLAGFCRTLGMLLETGIPISSALEITAQTTTNVYYAAALTQVSKEVKGGKTLAESMILFPKFFPISLVRVIGAGEKTGTLENNLDYMYGSYSSEVEEMANNMVTLLEPLLLIFAGLMIGLLAITIIAPIYQFSSSIN